MRRILLSVLALAWLSASQSIASADFMEVPAPAIHEAAAGSVQAVGSARLQSGNAQQLWRDSAHLEVGYYAVENGAARKQFVRPIDAALDDRQNEQLAQLGADALDARASDGVAQVMAGVFGVLWVTGFVIRRHPWQRVRSRA